MASFLKKLFSKNKTVKLEFCQNNLDRFFDGDSLNLFNEFLHEGAVTVKEFDCLSHCELCKKKPYVVAKGEMIKADDAKELLLRLRKLESKE